VVGGGIHLGYEAILFFDGTTYPSNPSVPPAKQSNSRKIKGRIVMPLTVREKPLYP